MELRLGTQVIGDDDYAIMATLPHPGPGTGAGACLTEDAPAGAARAGGATEAAAATEAAVAAERAAAAGARIVEVPADPLVVAAVRARLPEIVIACVAVAAEDARAAALAGADLLAGPPPVAVAAAATGAGYAGTDPAAAAAGGIPAERFVLDSGRFRTLDRVLRLAGSGHPVLVTPPGPGSAAAGRPELVAVAAACLWHGVRVFRTADVVTTRQALDMVASIKGTRQPALSRRALA